MKQVTPENLPEWVENAAEVVRTHDTISEVLVATTQDPAEVLPEALAMLYSAFPDLTSSNADPVEWSEIWEYFDGLGLFATLQPLPLEDVPFGWRLYTKGIPMGTASGFYNGEYPYCCSWDFIHPYKTRHQARLHLLLTLLFTHQTAINIGELPKSEGGAQ